MDKYIPLNFAIMASPVNWVIVFLMVLFAGIALRVVNTSITGNGE